MKILFLLFIIVSCSSMTKKEYCLNEKILDEKKCHDKWNDYKYNQRKAHQEFYENRPYLDRR